MDMGVVLLKTACSISSIEDKRGMFHNEPVVKTGVVGSNNDAVLT